MELLLYNRDGKLQMGICVCRWNGPRVRCDHIHPTLEISCVLSGTAHYHIDGQVYDVREGDVFLLPTTDLHGLEVGEGEAIDNLVIEFDPALLWEFSGDGRRYNFLPVFYNKGESFSHRLSRQNPATARVATLMREVLAEATEQRPCYELVLQNLLLQIFIEIVRGGDYAGTEEVQSPALRRSGEQLQSAIRYIDEHLSESIRLEDLAAVAHVSPAYFSSLFKKCSGQSPVAYILNRRIRAAIDLLRTTDRSIADIAVACGFHTSANFYKSFKHLTGRTPKEFRKSDTAGHAPTSLSA